MPWYAIDVPESKYSTYRGNAISPCKILLIFLDCRTYHIYRQWIGIVGKVRVEEGP